MELSENEIKVDGEDKKCLDPTLTDSATESASFEQLNSALLPKILSLTLTESKRSMNESSILNGSDNKVLEQDDSLMGNVEAQSLDQSVSNGAIMYERENGQPQTENNIQDKLDVQDPEKQFSTVEPDVKQVKMSTSDGSSASQMQQDTRDFEKVPLIRSLSAETLMKMFKFLCYGDLSGCALVNKSWWYAAIHVLWSEPFEFIFERDFTSETKQKKIFSLMQVYISCLKQDVKNNLVASGVSLSNEHLSIPTYDYPTFLQNLDIGFLYSACREWRLWLCRQEGNSLAQMMSNTVKDQQFLVYRELCKMFIKTSRAIKKFYLDEMEYSGFQCFDLLPMDPELRNLTILPNAVNCLPELTYFGCDGCVPRDLIMGLAEICHHIEHLSFRGCIDTGGFSGIFPLILSQKKLRHLTLIGNVGNCNTPNLTAVSSALKNIEHLTLVGTPRLDIKLFTYCHKIKYLELYDEMPDSNTCRVLNSIDASSLKIERIILRIYYAERYINKLVEVIKHAGTRLKMFDLEWRVQSNEIISGSSRILRSIALYCPNLLILRAPIILYHNEEISDSLIKVLRKCQNLVYLGIIGNSIFRFPNFLLKFASELPPKLEFFDFETIPKQCEEKVLCEFFFNIVKNLSRAISVEWNPFNPEYHNRIIREYVESGNIILRKLDEKTVFLHVGFETFHYRKRLCGKFDLRSMKNL